MSNQSEIADTGQGILQGVQPAQPRLAADWQAQRPDQAVSQQQPIVYAHSNGGGTNGTPFRWTDEDIERVRREEKDKLYPRIEELSNSMRQMQDERQAELAERQRLADEAAEAKRVAEEQEMGVRDLLTRKEQEWQQRITGVEQRYEQDRAVWERERHFQEVQDYKRNRIEQDQANILPELRGMVTGESIEAVDASIEMLKQTTEQIMANMAAATPVQTPFAPQRGASPTAPSVGPLEQLPAYETLTPEDIRSMDMETYKRYRAQLLQATNPRGR